jgi:hypothetical protein
VLPLPDPANVIIPGRARERDQLLHRLRRQGRMHDQNVGGERDQADRIEVPYRIVANLPEEARRGDQVRAVEEQGIAVFLRFRDDLAADHAVRSGAVVDDDLPPECFAQALRHDPAHGIDAAPGRDRHHHPHRGRGIAGRRTLCGGRHGAERGQQCGGARRAPETM